MGLKAFPRRKADVAAVKKALFQVSRASIPRLLEQGQSDCEKRGLQCYKGYSTAGDYVEEPLGQSRSN
jgi:hypothetical protein